MTNEIAREASSTPCLYANSARTRYVLCMKAKDVCPICKGPRKPYPENQAYPFCSGRCKLAELGHWLDGRYALPDEPVSQDEESDKPN
jgi:endogenous inhibitor of DNA gyrase (YacG/DUF329 family)